VPVALIVGGAGFIGANLARALYSRGFRVVVADDLSRGSANNLRGLLGRPGFDLLTVDCSEPDLLDRALGIENIDEIWHMAANSDIPAGVADYRVDLRQTFLTTVAVLDVMRRRSVPVIHFASSSAIYGDHGDTVIHEDIGPLQPISNYGAMKLASEAQLRAAKEAYVERVSIFRFPNVIGIPATHGVILDFVRKLKVDPSCLTVLGNGTQQKSYLHVSDLIDAMVHIANLRESYAVYNIGPTDHGVSVRFIAESVRDATSPHAKIKFGDESRGWLGDVPRFYYSVDKLLRTGWKPRLGSEAAIRQAVVEIVHQEAAK
jgi:UDP-glucose 4-epimerase